MAEDAAVLERVYPLSEMSRLQDLLADARGSVKALFVFAKLDAGRVGATVAVQATPWLVCQRCLQGFELPVASDSEIEFVTSEAEAPAESPREIYLMDAGTVSLRELAERLDRDDCLDWLRGDHFLDEASAGNLRDFARRQLVRAGCLPTDRTISVEVSRDPLGDWQVVLLSPLGSRFHLGLRLALLTR